MTNYPISIILFLILIIFPNINSYSEDKTVKNININGTIIYSEEELIKSVNLPYPISTGYPVDKIITEIKRFYAAEGYTLVNIYLLENSEKTLSIYIDEGRLDKIVFHKLNSIMTIKMIYKYNFKNNIFNENDLKKMISLIEEKEGYNIIRHKIIPSKNFDKSMFQFDRALKIPVIDVNYLPFFNKFGSMYFLEFHLGKISEGENREKGYIDYGLRSSYSKGFIPDITYYRTGLFTGNDWFKSQISTGIMYGFDRKFDQYPRMTFFEIDSQYQTAPFAYDFFTPIIKNKIYRSKSSRNDLGLLTYDYWLIKSVLAPGISLLKKIQVYAGLGLEDSIIINSKQDPEKNYHTEIIKEKSNYPFIESGIELAKYPFRYFTPAKQKISLTYNRYFYIKNFNEFEIKGIYDYEFKNNNLYFVRISYKKIWGDVPFYHEEPVNSMTFKGFMGESFHSRNIITLSDEILTSLYRDYIYSGVYVDAVIFRGSGYDLIGRQYGICAGPAFRMLMMDHFEIFFYYGKDFLFRGGKSGNNYSFGLNKKW